MINSFNATAHPVDCVYIAASTHDARFTRICVASVRYFYPEVRIRLLAGGRLQRRLAEELKYYWSVEMAPLSAGDYGWGFVKLEPLFGPPGERFLVLDSDTVLTGSVLDVWTESDTPFLVDDEKKSAADTKRLYYDWEKVRRIDGNARPPQFVFNSGQWFGTAGVLTRDDFAPWVEWTMPRRLRYPEHFMPGDQGILNYVLNQKAMLDGLRVERRKIMRWPGHTMQGLDAESVSKRVAAPLVVHWAGMKKARQRDMVGFDMLSYFERVFYSRLPLGAWRCKLRSLVFCLEEHTRKVSEIVSLVRRDSSTTESGWRAIKAIARRLLPEEWQLGRWVPRYLDELARRQTSGCVITGPFQGLLMPNPFFGTVYTPKLLGCYERELHSCIEKIIASEPDVVVDVGAAEGYYAVGLALRLPHSAIVAFEMQPEGRELLAKTAAANNVRSRLEIRGHCSPDGLTELIRSNRSKVTIVMDCEGAELELLDPEKTPDLRGCNILLETHEFKNPDAHEIFRQRFAGTHKITEIERTVRTSEDYPFHSWLTPFLPKIYIMLAVYEHRRPENRWLFMEPREPLPAGLI